MMDTGQGPAASYFQRLGPHEFLPSEHVGGAWTVEEQHIAPALGLLAHEVELDRDARRSDVLQLARLSFDILGTLPLDAVSVEVEVLRPGRSIDLVEARLIHDGRDALVLRAWLMKSYDTSRIAGTSFPAIEGPDDVEAWDPTVIWPGGFVKSVEVRRREVEPGRATVWVKSDVALIEDEHVSILARNVGLLDLANGMTPRVSSAEVAFPNLDLTVHFFNQARGRWLGFDTTVSLGASGIGLTESVIHDVDGPIGTMSQCLTVRPRS